MTAYNSVNGQHMDLNSKIIRDILRGEWGFEGLVMSDWGGTNSTLESLIAGLDLEMPGPPERRGKKLLGAIEADPSPQILAALNDSVTRVLRLAKDHDLLGLTPEEANKTRDSAERSSTTAEDVRLMRDIAASGIVLLKNSKRTLPLKAEEISGKQIAFIGPNALDGTPGGGGSAAMNPQYLSHPMESFKKVSNVAGIDVSVNYALGAYARKWLPLFSESQWSIDKTQGSKGMLKVDYYASNDLSGPIKETQYRGNSNIDVSDSSPLDFQVDPVPAYSFRVTSTVTPTATGEHSLSLSSVGGSRLYVDGDLIVDNSNWTEPGETFYAFGSAEARGTKTMKVSQQYEVTVEGWVNTSRRPDGAFTSDANHVFAAHPSVRIGYQEELPSSDDMIAEAVALADASATTVVVLGLSDEWESEGYDRKSMALPGDQDKLVEALIKRVQQPDSLVFINQSGSPVELPWIDQVSTFVQAWYGGQEAGNALVDVLLGNVNPSGRLPFTWPRRYSDLPFESDPEAWPGVNGRVIYKEDINVGYRWYKHNEGVKPQWWFGFGLSYTSFASKLLTVEDAGAFWTACVEVHNAGLYEGYETVQVYSWPSQAPEATALVAFEKTQLLQPDESTVVVLNIRKLDAARWEGGKWVLRGGRCMFGIGSGAGAPHMTALEIQVESQAWEPGVKHYM